MAQVGPHKGFSNSSLVPNSSPPGRTSQGLQVRQGSKNGARTEQTPGGPGGAVSGIREGLVECKVKDDLPERMQPSGGVVPIHHSRFNN